MNAYFTLGIYCVVAGGEKSADVKVSPSTGPALWPDLSAFRGGNIALCRYDIEAQGEPDTSLAARSARQHYTYSGDKPLISNRKQQL